MTDDLNDSTVTAGLPAVDDSTIRPVDDSAASSRLEDLLVDDGPFTEPEHLSKVIQSVKRYSISDSYEQKNVSSKGQLSSMNTGLQVAIEGREEEGEGDCLPHIQDAILTSPKVQFNTSNRIILTKTSSFRLNL